jgi:hypothetical protein
MSIFSVSLAATCSCPLDYRKSRDLPARLTGLSRVAAVVIAPMSPAIAAATKPSAAPGPFRLGLRFVDLQRASSQFRSIQGGNRFISFTSVRHFNKREPPRAAGFPVGHDTDSFDLTVCLENGSQLRFGGTVG